MTNEVEPGGLLTGALANNTADSYTFTVNAGGQLAFDLDFEQVPGQLRTVKLRVTDAFGREVLSKISSVDTAWHTVIGEAGTYTVDVSDAGFIDGNLLDYAISTSFRSEQHVTYELPIHETAASAMPILTGRPLIGALQAGEVDYFTLPVSGPGKLHLNFAHPTGPVMDGGAMSVQVIDSTSGQLLVDTLLRGSELITTDLGGSGTYLLRIADDSSKDHGVYSLIATTSDQSGNDFVQGSAANDVFTSSAGNNTFSGNGGFDTIRYDGNAADYRLAFSDAGTVVEAIGGCGSSDALLDIDRIAFADRTIDFGNMTNAAKIVRLYHAALNREPDDAGLSFWLHALDSGKSMHEVVHGFVDSVEFGNLYSKDLSNAELITEFYYNILGRAPEKGAVEGWLTVLDRGADIADVMEGFSESVEHQAMLVGQLSHGVEYVPYVG